MMDYNDEIVKEIVDSQVEYAQNLLRQEYGQKLSDKDYEISQLKQALIDIREYIKEVPVGLDEDGDNYYLSNDDWGVELLQIIDKVLGDSDK